MTEVNWYEIQNLPHIYSKKKKKKSTWPNLNFTFEIQKFEHQFKAIQAAYCL